MQRISVFAGSNAGARPSYLIAARELGAEIARRGHGMVYGGASCGLMGACAGAAHRAGGRVLGVIPRFLTSHERPLSVVETVVVVAAGVAAVDEIAVDARRAAAREAATFLLPSTRRRKAASSARRQRPTQ